MKKTLFLFSLTFWLAMFQLAAQSGYEVGDHVADFSLKNVDGNKVSLASYANAKGFIIAFTCNECPYAKMYEERLIALQKEFEPKGFPVIAINPNDPTASPSDSFEAMQKRAKEKSYPFPYLVDETQQVAKAFGATRTPHMYILSKTTKGLKLAYVGTIDNNPQDASAASEHYIKEAVADLLSGKEVKRKNTKAIGCTIKWKNS